MPRKKANSEAAGQKRLVSARDEELKSNLIRRRAALQAEVDKEFKALKERTTSHPDAMDAASDNIAGDLTASLSEESRKTLSRINDALARLEQGEYGNCKDCGEEIAPKRLNALPFAVRCTDCEAKIEPAKPWEKHSTQR